MKVKVKVVTPVKNGKGRVVVDYFTSAATTEYSFEISIVDQAEVKDVIDSICKYIEKNFPPGTKIVSVEETGRDNILNG